MNPQRIQLSRAKGWRMPEGAVSVARPTKWGNPYRVGEYKIDYPKSGERLWRLMAVSDFRGMVAGDWGDEFDYPLVAELAGKDLACWCPLDQPCHADVLLAVANPGWAP